MVYEGVSEEFTALWSITGIVYKSFTAKWDILYFVSCSFTALWRIGYYTSREFASMWDISKTFGGKPKYSFHFTKIAMRVFGGRRGGR